MHAIKIDCLVTELEYLSPEILRVRFRPAKPFAFSPGQFMSLVIPGALKKNTGVRRCYSFAASPESSLVKGYEICVKLVKEGKGAHFLKSLQVGDRFKALAPFGDFKLKAKNHRRNLCLISTGTGIAPFRSMLGSLALRACRYDSITLLHGVRHENEIIFAKDFQRAGVETRFTVSQPSPQWAGRRGRVTELLGDLARTLNFSKTDFFICGNGDMVADVYELLVSVYGVEPDAIVRENFSSKQKKKVA